MKATHLLLLFAVAGYSCSVEKQGSTKPDKESKVLEYLQNGFAEGDISTIPFDLNFHDLNPGPDYDVVFYQTLFKERLFLPPDDKLSEIESGKTLRLSWKIESAKVDRFLEKMMNDPYLSLYKQECARGMMTKTDLLADSSGEAASTLGRYIDIIIKEQAYSPGLIYYGLNRLVNAWAAENIAKAATSALNYQSEVVKNYDGKIALIGKGQTNDSNTEVLVEFKEIKRQNELYFARLADLSKQKLP